MKPKKVIRHPRDNMQFKNGKWQVRLAVPADVHGKCGPFNYVMPQTDYEAAYYHSRPILDNWRLAIAKARGIVAGDRQAVLANHHEVHSNARNGQPDYSGLFRAMDRVMHDAGIDHAAIQKVRGDLMAAVQNAPQSAKGLPTIQQIATGTTETPVTATKLSSFTKQFLQLTRLSAGAAKQVVALVEYFDASVGLSIEQLQTQQGEQAINHWLANEAKKRQWSEGTIKSRIGRLQSFWKFLVGHSVVRHKRGPFHGRLVPKGRTTGPMEGRRGIGPALAMKDVPPLWRFARTQWVAPPGCYMISREMVAAFILIAVYTGIRRSGIMGLTKANVLVGKDSGIRYIHVEEKIRGDSKAGKRDIPIHPMIADLITALCKTANPYLIDISGDWSEDSRHQCITDAVISVIEQAGLRTVNGENLHSLRKNFQQAMRNAGIDVEMRKQIFGHKRKELIEDPEVYGAEFSVEQTYPWICKISYPGEADQPLGRRKRIAPAGRDDLHREQLVAVQR